MQRLLLLIALIGCGGPASGDSLRSTDSCPSLGSVVITELAVRGTGYVEVYNSGRQGVDLSALDLSVAGSGAPRDMPVSGHIGAGRYSAVPVSALADGGGTVELTCAGQLVDKVHYARTDGDVLGLDGSQAPDSTLNDVQENWCAQLGSAGGANPACGVAACTDGDAPTQGDVLISEVMRDPVGADASGEWVELRNATDGALILDGLVLEEKASSTRRFTFNAVPCFGLGPNALLVVPLGGDDPPFFTRGSGLFNERATLILRAGDTVLEEVEVDCGRNGSSCALVDGEWCEAAAPTPGEENSCAR